MEKRHWLSSSRWVYSTTWPGLSSSRRGGLGGGRKPSPPSPPQGDETFLFPAKTHSGRSETGLVCRAARAFHSLWLETVPFIKTRWGGVARDGGRRGWRGAAGCGWRRGTRFRGARGPATRRRQCRTRRRADRSRSQCSNMSLRPDHPRIYVPEERLLCTECYQKGESDLWFTKWVTRLNGVLFPP